MFHAFTYISMQLLDSDAFLRYHKQAKYCSRWDYGYALLKEAGIYDSAGKPVKQREVINLFIGQLLLLLIIVKFGKI